MALTPSTMLPLGTLMPEFSLPNPAGVMVSSKDAPSAKAYLVMFLSNHCPYVKHVADTVAKVCRQYRSQGIAVFAVMSNDVERYPDDRPELMQKEAEKRGYDFPYLYDASQMVAKSFRAACTPEFYLFDSQRRLVYRGQLDASRPGNGIPPSGEDLTGAVEATLKGQPVAPDQKPSVGCNIKWRPGQEPQY